MLAKLAFFSNVTVVLSLSGVLGVSSWQLYRNSRIRAVTGQLPEDRRNVSGSHNSESLGLMHCKLRRDRFRSKMH